MKSSQRVNLDVSLKQGEANLEGYFVFNDVKKTGSYYAYAELTKGET